MLNVVLLSNALKDRLSPRDKWKKLFELHDITLRLIISELDLDNIKARYYQNINNNRARERKAKLN